MAKWQIRILNRETKSWEILEVFEPDDVTIDPITLVPKSDKLLKRISELSSIHNADLYAGRVLE